MHRKIARLWIFQKHYRIYFQYFVFCKICDDFCHALLEKQVIFHKDEKSLALFLGTCFRWSISSAIFLRSNMKLNIFFCLKACLKGQPTWKPFCQNESFIIIEEHISPEEVPFFWGFFSHRTFHPFSSLKRKN